VTHDYKDLVIEQLGDELLAAQELAVTYRQMALLSMADVARLTRQLDAARSSILQLRTARQRSRDAQPATAA
jgi:hypothetical protein